MFRVFICGIFFILLKAAWENVLKSLVLLLTLVLMQGLDRPFPSRVPPELHTSSAVLLATEWFWGSQISMAVAVAVAATVRSLLDAEHSQPQQGINDSRSLEGGSWNVARSRHAREIEECETYFCK